MKKTTKAVQVTKKPAKATKKSKVTEKVEDIITVAPTVKPGLAIPPRLTIAAGLGVAALALLAGLVYAKYWNIATVNGRPISRLDYIKAMEGQIGKQTLENMITETLIKDAAQKQNVSVDSNAIAAEITTIEEQIKQQGQTLDAALAEEGMTRTELEEQIQIQKMVEIMGQGDVSVTDEQVAEFLETNKDSLPANQSAEELQSLAREQLTEQTKSTNIRAWLSELRAGANIIYK